MTGLIVELKRRKVIQVGVAYLVLAWLVMQVTGFIVPALFLPDWVPTLVVFLGIIGFPFALFFSWVYDLTPQGVIKTPDVETVSDVDAPPDITVEAGVEEALPDGNAKSVAVLPFVNMSSDVEQEYFSDGITEDILNALVAVDGLSVVGRTSSFAFKGKNEDLRDIGSALGVDHLVEGSVQKAGVRVRITAQLIRADNGTHLWSATYDRDLTDIFAVQDEISAAVANALQITLLGRHSRKAAAPIDADAYDLYLRALQNVNTASFASLAEAAEQLERVKKIAADFLEARTRLAYVRTQQVRIGSLPEAEGLRLAEEEAQAVLTIDPGYANAHVVLAVIAFERSEQEAVRRHIDAALEKGANSPDLWLIVMRFRFKDGDITGMHHAIDQLVRLDPLRAEVHYRVGATYKKMGDYKSALHFFEHSIELQPGSPSGWGRLGLTKSEATGDLRGAIDSHIQAIALDPDDPDLPAFLADDYLDIGMLGEAMAAVYKARALGPARGLTHLMQAKLNWLEGNRGAALKGVTRSLHDPATWHRWGSKERQVWLAAQLHMEADDFDAAEDVILKASPQLAALASSPPKITKAPDRFVETTILLQIYRATGRTGEATSLATHTGLFTADDLRQIDTEVAGSPLIGLAMVALAGGDETRALDQLDAAYDGGFARNWRAFYRSAAFYELWQHPRHKALMARITADADRQRAALLAEAPN